MNSISEEQFYDLLSLKLSGDASSEELALLQEQLLLNPRWQFLYDQMMKPTMAPPNALEHTQQAYAAHAVKMHLQAIGETDADNDPSSNDFSNSLPSRTPQLSGYRKMAYFMLAAATLAGIIIWIGLPENITQLHKTNRAFNEVVTKKGSKSNIKLPDGTRVWLNADSKLTYKENFSEENREVVLVGEAYFDVQSDKDHPFIIHAGKENIKVLGTAFNVRNYPQDKLLETTLMRGKIEVSFSGRPDKKIILQPFEKLTALKEKDSSFITSIYPIRINTSVHKPVQIPAANTAPKNDSVVAETAWMIDKMVFINQPLGEIAQELERHFAITVRFKNPDVARFRYTGVFDNISLENILQILRESRKINYSLSGKNLTIE